MIRNRYIKIWHYMLAGLKSDEYSSIYSAVKSLKISKATLRMCVKGLQSHVNQQNPSNSEEKYLVK